MLLIITKVIAALEVMSLGFSLVRAAYNGVLWTSPFKYHKSVVLFLLDGLYKAIAEIPRLILAILLTVMSIPLIIIWASVPGLKWILPKPDLTKWIS